MGWVHSGRRSVTNRESYECDEWGPGEVLHRRRATRPHALHLQTSGCCVQSQKGNSFLQGLLSPLQCCHSPTANTGKLFWSCPKKVTHSHPLSLSLSNSLTHSLTHERGTHDLLFYSSFAPTPQPSLQLRTLVRGGRPWCVPSVRSAPHVQTVALTVPLASLALQLDAFLCPVACLFCFCCVLVLLVGWFFEFLLRFFFFFFWICDCDDWFITFDCFMFVLCDDWFIKRIWFFMFVLTSFANITMMPTVHCHTMRQNCPIVDCKGPKES